MWSKEIFHLGDCFVEVKYFLPLMLRINLVLFVQNYVVLEVF